MSLFDILSGRVGYFNEVAVPAYNSISRKVQGRLDAEGQVLFGVVALAGIASKSIELFFKPGSGVLLSDIKKYSQGDFEKLYAVFIIWAFFDFTSIIDKDEKESLKKKMFSILDLSESEFIHYYNALNHTVDGGIDFSILWNEVLNILKTMPDSEENFLVFRRDFSRICKASYQVL